MKFIFTVYFEKYTTPLKIVLILRYIKIKYPNTNKVFGFYIFFTAKILNINMYS